MMFDNFESQVTGFNSSWKTGRINVDGECQTQELKSKEVECSSVALINISTQTETLEADVGEMISPLFAVSAWLQELTPTVLEELVAIKNTQPIFKSYVPFYCEEESESKVKLLHRLQPLEEKLIENENSASRFSVIDICWSNSGNSLAIGYGLPYHEHWCQHNGFVHIYIKSSTQDMLKHNIELKLPACASVVAYHPTESPVFTAATVSGDICMWNMQHQSHDSTVASWKVRLPTRVSSLLWLTNSHAQHIFHDKQIISSLVLVSANVDGTVIIWLASKTLSTVVKYKRYKLYESTITNTQLIPDITCMDFLKFETNEYSSPLECLSADIFCVGCRTGEILLCRISSAIKITGSADLNPLVNYLEPHTGCVLSLSCSPSSNRPLVLTLGADMEIRVYVVPQANPVEIICLERQLSRVTWMSGSNRLIVGAVGECRGGTQLELQVFDITLGKKLFSIDGLHEVGLNSKTVEKTNNSHCALSALTFSPKSPNILACGDTRGVVYIWTLPLY